MRKTLTAAAAALAALATAAPAHAQATTRHWGAGPVQGVTTVVTSGTGVLTATASGQLLGVVGSRAYVTFQCTEAAPAAVSVGRTSCYLRGSNGYTIQGSANGASVAGDLPVQRYRVCHSGSATFLDGRVAAFNHCTRDITTITIAAT